LQGGLGREQSNSETNSVEKGGNSVNPSHGAILLKTEELAELPGALRLPESTAFHRQNSICCKKAKICLKLLARMRQ
jgi:hypothetical protein